MLVAYAHVNYTIVYLSLFSASLLGYDVISFLNKFLFKDKCSFDSVCRTDTIGTEGN
jgi:hypothetical protein